jgi:dTDP-4-amino-4,6-dideoxygalactose transaminase
VITYAKQFIYRSDSKLVKSVLFSDWLTMGPRVEEFEKAIEGICGAKNFVVSSGTAALHCAYSALNLNPGDEIITTPLTFIATQSTAMHFGAKIVFCDVESSTGNIDPKKIESLITNRTRAISVVDYAGHPADLSSFRAICDKYGLYLIEDASHSIGSRYKNKPVGTFADFTTFSFFPTKNFTTGEGGAVASINDKLLEKAKEFGRQGLIRDPRKFVNTPDGRWHQEVHKIGLNYRLTDIQCALGISQIKKISKFKKKREAIYNFYNESLSEVSEIKLPQKADYADPMWHLYPLRVLGGLRNKLFETLWDYDVRVQVNYIPVYFHPVFQELGYKKGLCPVAEKYYSEEISLPLHVSLSDKDLRKIVRVVKQFFGY